LHKREDHDPVERLRRRGVRVTPQRAAILGALLRMEGHPTAQQVFEHAADDLPQLNLATVYRNLYRLYEAGIVDLLTTPTGVQRFAYRDPEHLHAHLVCNTCDQVVAVPPDLFEALGTSILDNHGFEIDSRHLTFTGICDDCLGGHEGWEG
jgi:Fe2+ or Zn2+ uptake regulation protein